MSRFRIGRPSPALVVSTVALVVATGGTGYAAFSLPKNSVGTRQLKTGAVTTKKIKHGQVTTSKIANGAVTKTKLNVSGVTVPNAAAVGGRPIRWLLVDPVGTIVSQSGGFTVDAHPSPGVYSVDAGSPVHGHAIVASDSAASLTALPGVTIAGPCGTGSDSINCGGSFNNGTHIFVSTLNAGDTAEQNHSFYLLVY